MHQLLVQGPRPAFHQVSSLCHPLCWLPNVHRSVSLTSCTNCAMSSSGRPCGNHTSCHVCSSIQGRSLQRSDSKCPKRELSLVDVAPELQGTTRTRSHCAMLNSYAATSRHKCASMTKLPRVACRLACEFKDTNIGVSSQRWLQLKHFQSAIYLGLAQGKPSTFAGE